MAFGIILPGQNIKAPELFLVSMPMMLHSLLRFYKNTICFQRCRLQLLSRKEYKVVSNIIATVGMDSRHLSPYSVADACKVIKIKQKISLFSTCAPVWHVACNISVQQLSG